MRKIMSILVALLFDPAHAGTAVIAPPPKAPVKTVKKAEIVKPRPNVQKKTKTEEKVLVLPAPEFTYKGPGLDEFERKKEALKREKELLQIQVEIEKLRAELEKYRLGSKLAKVKSVQPKQTPRTDTRRELIRMQMERERLRMLENRLSLLQNLFAGVMQVGDRKVAFDSAGRKYFIGSTVYGFRILDIQSDGIVVAFGPQVFKVPLSSGIPEKGKNIQSSFQQPTLPPPPVESEVQLPPEVPPPPLK